MAASPNYDGANTPALYIGTAGGGVWRSIDFSMNSPTWKPLTDHWPTVSPQRRQNLLDVGALAVDPWNPRTIYAGTGDPPGLPGTYARGYMLKSTDGGDTYWSLLDFTTHDQFTAGIGQVFVDPTDPTGRTVYASGGIDSATNTVYAIRKSIDGGNSWAVTQAGLPPNIRVTGFDCSIRNGSLVLYAGVRDTSGVNPTNSTIWESVNQGASWAPMTIAPLTDLQGRPRSQSEIDGITLATNAPQDPRTGGRPAFAAVTWPDPNAGYTLMNVFELVGNTWQPAGGGLPTSPGSEIQTFSAFSMAMSPTNDVYIGAVTNRHQGLFQRLSSTGTWVSIDQGVDGSQPHTDHRTWCFVGGNVYNGNDGGVSRFKPRPDGTPGPGVWESLNTPSLQTNLVNGVGMHPSYPRVLAEGSQDNGVALRYRGSWTYLDGGDNGPVRFDPYDARYVYATGVSDPHFFFRSDNGGKFLDKSPPKAQNIPGYASFAFHPVEAGRICVGSDMVHETIDHGDGWNEVSPPLTPQQPPFGDPIRAVAYGRGNSGTIFAAYSSQRLFRTTDGGNSWPEIMPQGGNWRGTIISIVTDPHNAARVYAATDTGAIWRSPDGGSTWSEIAGNQIGGSTGLTVHALDLRSDSSTQEPTLFAATTDGVWMSTVQNGTFSWSQMDGGLPDTDVTDLQFNPTNKNIVAGLYGRGVFAAYLHLKSGVSPGSVSIRDRVFTFAADLDERVLVNQAKLDDAFSGWSEVQGNGHTDAAPSAIAIGDRLFVFIKETDTGKIRLNQAELGNAFLPDWVEVQGHGRTGTAPSAVAVEDRLFARNRLLVFIEDAATGHILWNMAVLDGPFLGQWPEVEGHGRTDAAPSAVAVEDLTFIPPFVWPSNRLFVFIRDAASGKVLLNQAVQFGLFFSPHWQSQWVEVQGIGHTDAAPSAVAIGKRLFVFIKEAISGKVLLNQAELDGPFFPRWLDQWVEVQGNGRTDAAPSAMALGNRLFVFIKDAATGRILWNTAVLDGPFSPQWQEVDGGLV